MPKNKHSKTRAKIKAEKEKRKGVTLFLAIVLLGISLLTYFAYTLVTQSSSDLIEPDMQFTPENPNSQFKAVIVDHLNLTFSNQNFVETAAKILTSADYTVDYFDGEKVTVEFYRTLPMRGYSLIILRVHSSATSAYTGTENPLGLGLFTSEPYDRSKYIPEQLTNQVGSIAYSMEEAERGIAYFGISPLFVAKGMKGKFNNPIIIMMGCEGLKNTKMAEAFIERGAKAYIGWNASVTASRTDTATTRLLHYLIMEKQMIGQAVENTMKDVGPDPADNSFLLYYPAKAGKEKIETIP
ncbi:MAG: hypothetical protein QXR63_07575 [Candidatus Bathyarchaeia archaeon]